MPRAPEAPQKPARALAPSMYLLPLCQLPANTTSPFQMLILVLSLTLKKKSNLFAGWCFCAQKSRFYYLRLPWAPHGRPYLPSPAHMEPEGDSAELRGSAPLARSKCHPCLGRSVSAFPAFAVGAHAWARLASPLAQGKGPENWHVWAGNLGMVWRSQDSSGLCRQV